MAASDVMVLAVLFSITLNEQNVESGKLFRFHVLRDVDLVAQDCCV